MRETSESVIICMFQVADGGDVADESLQQLQQR